MWVTLLANRTFSSMNARRRFIVNGTNDMVGFDSERREIIGAGLNVLTGPKRQEDKEKTERPRHSFSR